MISTVDMSLGIDAVVGGVGFLDRAPDNDEEDAAQEVPREEETGSVWRTSGQAGLSCNTRVPSEFLGHL